MKKLEKNSLIKNDILAKIMLNVSSFPSMPKTALNLMDLVKKEDVSADEMEKMMRNDPGLTANVLKLSNSAYFGIPAKVGSLKQAVLLLGLKRFTQIVVASCTSHTMNKHVEGYDIPPGALWQHSVAVSKTAEALAKFAKLTDSIDFFTPALLHDMGKLVLGIFVKNEIQTIQAMVANGVPLVVAEHMVLGTDHAEIGSQILANWSFPSDIVNAVRWHHNPERLKNSNMQPEIVYLSNLLCQSSERNSADDRPFTVPSPVVLQRLNISKDQYRSIFDKTTIWLNQLSDRLVFA
jgi:putative nucleotidyltransferase with HDIG domain